ncbi:jg10130 [Pararge aegeria aegeria]|uniref:Jg10130 protein n=1 Tax=Pararge aegeria aegeria TaxID=348720 RepID=A0A8S4RAQ0_9NEOP|nr:jg10130 [Pararge aegeria aegeria]
MWKNVTQIQKTSNKHTNNHVLHKKHGTNNEMDWNKAVLLGGRSITDSPLCRACMETDERPIHVMLQYNGVAEQRATHLGSSAILHETLKFKIQKFKFKNVLFIHDLITGTYEAFIHSTCYTNVSDGDNCIRQLKTKATRIPNAPWSKKSPQQT